MTAPPPMPNRPARIPVTTPPTTMAAASQRSSLSGTANMAAPDASGGGDESRSLVRYQCKRLPQHVGAGVGPDTFGRDMATERARPRHRMKQAEHMAGDRVEAHAARDRALDVGEEGLRGSLRRSERRRRTEQHGIDRQEPPRLLVGGAAH